MSTAWGRAFQIRLLATPGMKAVSTMLRFLTSLFEENISYFHKKYIKKSYLVDKVPCISHIPHNKQQKRLNVQNTVASCQMIMIYLVSMMCSFTNYLKDNGHDRTIRNVNIKRLEKCSTSKTLICANQHVAITYLSMSVEMQIDI